jgi:hypothetical protein
VVAIAVSNPKAFVPIMSEIDRGTEREREGD